MKWERLWGSCKLCTQADKIKETKEKETKRILIIFKLHCISKEMLNFSLFYITVNASLNIFLSKKYKNIVLDETRCSLNIFPFWLHKAASSRSFPNGTASRGQGAGDFFLIELFWWHPNIFSGPQNVITNHWALPIFQIYEGLQLK